MKIIPALKLRNSYNFVACGNHTFLYLLINNRCVEGLASFGCFQSYVFCVRTSRYTPRYTLTTPLQLLNSVSYSQRSL
jgi:hypothetical protein